jgi:hypothetical protein
MDFLKYILVSVILVFLCFGAMANDIQYGVVDPRENGYILDSDKPIPDKEWNESTKLWLGRSCVGEAGFSAYEECIGIAWVCATRYRELGGSVSLERIIRRYSAAVKKRSTHRRPWILSLNLNGDKPDRWPSKLSWKVHKSKWMKILSELDHWAIGNRDNPVEGANHWGGKMDTPGALWVRIKPKNGMEFNNIFYRSRF